MAKKKIIELVLIYEVNKMGSNMLFSNKLLMYFTHFLFIQLLIAFQLQMEDQ